MQQKFMEQAIELAKKARAKNEVPVGAVVVLNGKVLAKGYNKRETKQNALLHAELIAINKACKKLKSWRLENCELYVTLEPCAMCAGAVINSRIKKVYFGAYDKKGGAFGSAGNFAGYEAFNHTPEVLGGVMEQECSNMLKEFFKNLRKK